MPTYYTGLISLGPVFFSFLCQECNCNNEFHIKAVADIKADRDKNNHDDKSVNVCGPDVGASDVSTECPDSSWHSGMCEVSDLEAISVSSIAQ